MFLARSTAPMSFSYHASIKAVGRICGSDSVGVFAPVIGPAVRWLRATKGKRATLICPDAANHYTKCSNPVAYTGFPM